MRRMSTLFEFAQSRAILTEAEAMEAIERAHVSGIAVEQVLRRLKAVSFLGLETARGRFEYPEGGQAADRAEVLARMTRTGPEGSERLMIHPAFHAYLEIMDEALVP